jgi:FixJ family two-component response regulator
MPTAPIVFVVDDDVSVRNSLELLVRSVGWHAETFATATEFLRRQPADGPSCLVLDVALPDVSGLDLQALLADRTGMPVIFITGHADVPMTVRAMKAGAADFLTKPFEAEMLLFAVRLALERSTVALARKAQWEAVRDCYESLSRREREVLALVVDGRLNKQVGGELGISEITVKAHRGKVMRKMQADSLPDLVRKALILGASNEKGGEARIVASF